MESPRSRVPEAAGHRQHDGDRSECERNRARVAAELPVERDSTDDSDEGEDDADDLEAIYVSEHESTYPLARRNSSGVTTTEPQNYHILDCKLFHQPRWSRGAFTAD
jgi:hypothetical protein